MAVKPTHNPYDHLDFDKLLRPYAAAGTADHPRKRTLGLIFDFLLNKHKYPIEVAATAVLETFLELQAGKVFHGDGSYGSAGRELVLYIRHRADALNQKRLSIQGKAYAQHILNALEHASKRSLRDKFQNWMRWGYWQ